MLIMAQKKKKKVNEQKPKKTDVWEIHKFQLEAELLLNLRSTQRLNRKNHYFSKSKKQVLWLASKDPQFRVIRP